MKGKNAQIPVTFRFIVALSSHRSIVEAVGNTAGQEVWPYEKSSAYGKDYADPLPPPVYNLTGNGTNSSSDHVSLEAGLPCAGGVHN